MASGTSIVGVKVKDAIGMLETDQCLENTCLGLCSMARNRFREMIRVMCFVDARKRYRRVEMLPLLYIFEYVRPPIVPIL